MGSLKNKGYFLLVVLMVRNVNVEYNEAGVVSDPPESLIDEELDRDERGLLHEDAALGH